MTHARRAFALLLTLLLLLGLALGVFATEDLPPGSVAAEERASNRKITLYKDGTLLLDLNGGGKTGAFTWMATGYLNGTTRNGVTTLVLPNSSSEWIYCIDYYSTASTGSYNTDSLTDSYYWLYTLSKTARDGITHALIYGCPNYTDETLGSSELFTYAATQLIIWEYQLGQRTNAAQSVSFFSAMLNSNAHLRRAYNGILLLIAQHDTAPSLKSVTLKGYGEEYAVTVMDSSGRLANDAWEAVGATGLHVTQSGNSLTVWADTGFQGGTVTLRRKLNVITGSALTAEAGSGGQQVLVGVPDDPLSATLSVAVEIGGSMTAQKVSDSGDVAGYCFKIYSWAQNRTWYAKTDSDGVLRQSDSTYTTLGSSAFEDFRDGDYSFLEVLSQKGAGLVAPESWKLTVTDAGGNVTFDKTFIDADMTTDANGDCRLEKISLSGLTGGGQLTMAIRNVPLTADLEIIKTSPDGKIGGIPFAVYDSDGAEIASGITNENGRMTVEGLQIGQIYTVTETVPEGYVCTENDKKITIRAGVNTVSFENKPLPSLKIIKTSPDGNVSGIPFKIYTSEYAAKLDNVWRTAVTDEDGVILLDDLPAGTYWIKENVPEGYQAQAVQKVTVTEENTGENPAVVTFVNVPNPCLKLIKTSEDGNVAGITFQLFTGRSAPTQDAVPQYTVTTGDDGTLLLKNLSVGIYWVREVLPEGYTPQEVRKIRVLSSNTPDNPATVRFDNSLLRGSISANKVDLGGEPLSGAIFLLEYSVDNGVTWQAVRPASADDSGIGTCAGVDADGTITTGADGKAIFSDLIVYGVTYRLTETAAPNGYQLLAEPVFMGSLSANAEQKYELTFDVANAPLLQMPPTGGAGNLRTVVSLATTVLLLGVLGITVALRRKKAN